MLDNKVCESLFKNNGVFSDMYIEKRGSSFHELVSG